MQFISDKSLKEFGVSYLSCELHYKCVRDHMHICLHGCQNELYTHEKKKVKHWLENIFDAACFE